jgi:hypothetical protein
MQAPERRRGDIVQQLAPHIIPAMNRVPDPRLASNADQPWFNYVPIPLSADNGSLLQEVLDYCFGEGWFITLSLIIQHRH